MPDVISEGFTQLRLSTLQIPGVIKTHVRVLEVTGEDLLEVNPTINDVSWQMIQPGHGGIK
jgi:hypothetical protein